MKKSRPGRLATAALSLAAIASSPALAQDGTGIRGNLSFSTGLELSDNPFFISNPDSTEFTSVTDLGFSVNSETKVDQLRFTLGIGIEGREGGGATNADALDIVRQSAAASYVRTGANSRLSLSGRFNEADLDDEAFGFFVDGAFDPDALIVDGGSREFTRLSAAFSTGIDAPFGVDLSFSTSASDYIGTTDDDLVNTDTTRLDAVARFQINPATTARLFANQISTDFEDPTDTSRDFLAIGASVTTETRDGLTLSAGLSLDDSETFNGNTPDGSEDGIGLTFGAEQARPDGALRFDVSSRVDETGRRSIASVSRDYVLPTGAMTLSLGVADQENSDTEFTTSIDYSRETPGGTLTANIVQSPSTDEGLALLNTSVELGYNAPIDPVSSWGASFSYGASELFGGGDADTRTSATIRYTRDLNKDWDLNAGLRVRRVDDSEDGAISSNTLFVNIGRDFSFGF